MIFVNDVLYRQVLSLQEMGPGKFYVNEDTDKVYLQGASGVSITSAQVEVSVRSGLVTISGRRNVVVKGFIIERANTSLNGAGGGMELLQDCKNIAIEDNVIRWNNRTGLFVHQKVSSHENISITRTRLNNNGHQGMQIQATRNILVTDSETSYNSWRHKWL